MEKSERALTPLGNVLLILSTLIMQSPNAFSCMRAPFAHLRARATTLPINEFDNLSRAATIPKLSAKQRLTRVILVVTHNPSRRGPAINSLFQREKIFGNPVPLPVVTHPFGPPGQQPRQSPQNQQKLHDVDEMTPPHDLFSSQGLAPLPSIVSEGRIFGISFASIPLLLYLP